MASNDISQYASYSQPKNAIDFILQVRLHSESYCTYGAVTLLEKERKSIYMAPLYSV